MAPPPLPVVIAIRLDSTIEFEVHPLDEDDPLGSAELLAVGSDIDGVVIAVPAAPHRTLVPTGEPAGTLLHLVGRQGEAATRWIDRTGAVTILSADPDIDGGQLHQRARAILFPPE